MNRMEAVLKAATDNISDVKARGDLNTRNNDHEDFLDGISVWSLKKALEDAYDAGRISAVVPNMDKAVKLGWTVTVDEDGSVGFAQCSPAGEDFSFRVAGNDIPREVYEYAQDFDMDEHIDMWIHAKESGTAGVPGYKTLVDDADAIQDMLNDLADALNEEE